MKVEGEFISKSDNVTYLGLRLDANLQWSSHINYVISRINLIRVVKSRFAYMFDTSLRIYLAKVLVFPVINLYDFIYGTAPSKYLRLLDTSYNDLIRSILGLRRSQHYKITDMYAMTSFDSLDVRRWSSLLKFMLDVKSDRQYSKLRTCFVKASHTHETRAHENYVIPRCRTLTGRQRISVRGLSLLNNDRATVTLRGNADGSSAH
jgi:hypothetical protein